MGMHEKPAKPKPMDPPSRRQAMREQSAERWERAEKRLQFAKLAHHTRGSLATKRKAIRNAINAGLIKAGGAPVPSTIADLMKKFELGARSIEDYLDAPRPGREKKPLDLVFQRHLQQAVQEASNKSERELVRECVALARARGLTEPTRHQVREFLKRGYRLKHAAGRHGSRAGEIDGLPHGRIFSRFVNDAWCLDELTFPVWARVPDPTYTFWMSVLCDIVIIVDVRSTAVVGWHLVDPEGRLDEKGEPIQRGGTRSKDVFAALLSAACRELAPDSTAAFAGYLPSVLRWDNHKAHKALATRMAEAGIGLDLHFIRKRRAISNGSVENRVGTLKRWTKGIRGHVDRHLPTDQVKNDAAAEQSVVRTALSGGTSDRTTERLPIDPCDLLDVHELRDAFNAIVRRYNHEHVNRVFNQTAAQRFFRYRRPRQPRKGRDLVGMIEPADTTVTKNGILLYQDNQEFAFEPMLDDAILMLDSTVIYRPDPLMRGIFVERDGQHHFLIPTPGEQERAQEIARNQIAIARLISDNAKVAREARRRVEIGPEASARADENYKRAREALKEGADREAVAEPDVAELVQASEDVAPRPDLAPYGADDIDAFVRPVRTNGKED